jgi:RNA polymerase sigma factor (TIGR02999 family)
MAAPTVTQLLVAWSNGDDAALDQLAPLVHRELHRLAAAYMAGERPGHVLQATALVNEAYLRLIDWKEVRWQNRAHFFAVAARLMRHVLVDVARAQRRAKRGGRGVLVSLSDAAEAAVPGPAEKFGSRTTGTARTAPAKSRWNSSRPLDIPAVADS